MAALIIAIGNPMRHDDGVAHRVEIPRNVARRAVLQLTPEIAAEVAHYETVVFVDADVSAKEVRIGPVDTAPSPGLLALLLAHVCRPAEIVAIARALFGFSGHAYTCHIPVSDLSEGEGLSRSASQFSQQASRAIDGLITAI